MGLQPDAGLGLIVERTAECADVRVTLEQVIQLYEVVSKALKKQESLLLTLNRFNSCWLREIDHDRIIDAAICLESIIASSTEISFKFSLFLVFQ